MSFIEPKELIERLQKDFGYPPQGATLVASKIMRLQPSLHKDFLTWWQNGAIPQQVIEGYSVENLMRDYEQNPIAAILTLDWLLREPEEAKKAIKQGYDRVIAARAPETAQ